MRLTRYTIAQEATEEHFCTFCKTTRAFAECHFKEQAGVLCAIRQFNLFCFINFALAPVSEFIFHPAANTGASTARSSDTSVSEANVCACTHTHVYSEQNFKEREGAELNQRKTRQKEKKNLGQSRTTPFTVAHNMRASVSSFRLVTANF